MTSVALPRPVLADQMTKTVARDVALVVGLAALTALMAQVRVPVPFSPVPITGQTFAVLLGAAALGPVRAVLGQGLYVLAGLAGLPVFAEWAGGLDVVLGVTGGYLVGFVLASLVVGALARRGVDRRPHGMVLAFVLGSATIYAVAVPWLAVVTGGGLQSALWQGAGVFLVGDALKAGVAAWLVPTAWRIAGDR